MGIYLGQVGNIELTRKSLDGNKESIVNPSDVNAARSRFSFDFEEGCLISGDLVEFTTTDGTNLDFVATTGWSTGTRHPSGNWYVFVDQLGGIKLYSNFDDSLNGGITGRVALSSINRDIPIRVKVRDIVGRLIGNITDYEINTNRETVDITTLSDQHRQQYSSLITGSGSLSAQWDYINNSGKESAHYLLQLVVRTEVGSSFRGKFYIKTANAAAQTGSTVGQLDDSLWWEFDALVTGAAVGFTPGGIVSTTIDFVSTGPIQLLAKTASQRYLLQENTGKIELEQDTSSYILLEEPE
jgi:sporulation protein YlmC with PRC-barrel domain